MLWITASSFFTECYSSKRYSVLNSAVILPVKDPDDSLLEYIKGLISNGVKKLIVVDDGSEADCGDLFDEIKELPQCDLIRQEENCGIAWALKDAMDHYLDKGYNEVYNGVAYVEYLGRYAYSDIERVSEAMDSNPESIIISERTFDDGVEKNKKIGNRIMIMIYDFLYGIRVKDPQSGLRGFPNKIIPRIMKVDGVDYEYMINMVIEGQKHGMKPVCLKNEKISTNAQVFTKPYPKKNAGFIYKHLIIHFIKYIISALVSFALDVTLFQIFVGMLQPYHEAYILMATIFARAISSVWTFTFNRKVVFHSKDNLIKSLLKFYGLVAIQMFSSGVLVTLIFRAIRIIPEAVIKVIVDFSIFLISYKVEKQFIFK